MVMLQNGSMKTKKVTKITIFGAITNGDIFCIGLEFVAEVHSNLAVPDFDWIVPSEDGPSIQRANDGIMDGRVLSFRAY